MSYSFNVRAASKVAVLALVTTELDKVVAGQPIHEADRAQAEAAAAALTALCVEPGESEEVSITVTGWLQWRDGDGEQPSLEFIGGGIGVQATIVAKTD